MAEGDIWISEFFSDSRYVRSTDVDRTLPGWLDVAARRIPPPETLPLPIYTELKDDMLRNIPPISKGGGV
jgi:hypothetical protein